MLFRTADSGVNVFACDGPLAPLAISSNFVELHLGILAVMGANPGVDGRTFHLICLALLRRAPAHLRPLHELFLRMLLGPGESAQACPGLAFFRGSIAGPRLSAEFP